jgi:uncharacterized membrane protein HdeD (DUF308 family)
MTRSLLFDLLGSRNDKQRLRTVSAIGGGGIVRENSFTLPKRQNRISRPLISCISPGRSERFDGRSKYLEFCSDNAPAYAVFYETWAIALAPPAHHYCRIPQVNPPTETHIGETTMPEGSDQPLSDLLRQGLRERLAEAKGNVFWTGAALAVIGILALIAPTFTTLTVAFMIGWVLIFAGAVTIYGAFSVEGTGPFFGQLLLGLLMLALGIYLMMHPGVNMMVLTIMLAVIFMVDGATQLVLAFEVRPLDGWIWLLLSGLVSIGVGLLIAAELPDSSRVALGILVGAKFLATGIGYIVFSRALPSPSAN